MDSAGRRELPLPKQLGLSRIFSLDHHFRIYRWNDSRAVEVVPRARRIRRYVTIATAIVATISI